MDGAVWSFANLDQFAIDSHFSIVRQDTIDPSVLLWVGYSCFTKLGQDASPR